MSRTGPSQPHDVPLLELAAVALGRAVAARELVDRDGVTVRSARGAPRLHPLLRIEELATRRFATLLRQLGFDDAEPAASPRRGAR